MASWTPPKSPKGAGPVGFQHRAGCMASTQQGSGSTPPALVLGGAASADMLLHQACLLGPITCFVEWAVLLTHHQDPTMPVEFLKMQLNGYVHRVLQEVQASHSMVIVAMLYIHRFFGQKRHGDLCGPCLFVIALVTAYKFLEDLSKLMKEWVAASGLTQEQLAELERVFLRDLKFCLAVSPEEFALWKELYEGEPLVGWWRGEVRGHINRYQQLLDSQIVLLQQVCQPIVPLVSAFSVPSLPLFPCFAGFPAGQCDASKCARSGDSVAELSRAPLPSSSASTALVAGGWATVREEEEEEEEERRGWDTAAGTSPYPTASPAAAGTGQNDCDWLGARLSAMAPFADGDRDVQHPANGKRPGKLSANGAHLGQPSANGGLPGLPSANRRPRGQLLTNGNQALWLSSPDIEVEMVLPHYQQGYSSGRNHVTCYGGPPEGQDLDHGCDYGYGYDHHHHHPPSPSQQYSLFSHALPPYDCFAMPWPPEAGGVGGAIMGGLRPCEGLSYNLFPVAGAPFHDHPAGHKLCVY